MTLHGFVRLAASLVSSLSQVSVTTHLLRKQKRGTMIVLLSLLSPLFSWLNTRVLWEMRKFFPFSRSARQLRHIPL